MDKQQLIDRLKDSPVFKASIGAVSDPVEREAIIARAVSFVSQVADVMTPVIDQMLNSPDFADLLKRELQKKGNDRSEEVVTK